MTHPSDSALLDYVDGAPSPEARAAIAAHLEECERCRDFVARLNDDTSPSRKLSDIDPSLDVTRNRDPLTGTQIGEYRILERLGVGGMGIIYRGEQPLIGKPVAIKVLLQSIANDPVLVHRMLGEARAVNAARHPNIVDIFSFGQLPDGRPYMVMELLEGQSLASILAEHQRLDVAQTLRVLAESMAGLEAAHAVGVVHRDLKPDNIFVNPKPEGWKVKLLDFGLAKQRGPTDQRLTNPGSVMGTPGYMAPEQVRGAETVSPKTDIYAMGVVAWTLLVGREPFGDGSIVEVMHRHLTMPPPSLRAAREEVPAALEALVMRMLEKDPERRPGAAEVRHAVLAQLSELSGPSPVAPAAAPAAPPPSRGPLFAGLALLGFAAVAGAFFLMPQAEEPRPTPVIPAPLPIPKKVVKDPPPEVAQKVEPPAVVTPPVIAPPKEKTTAMKWRCSRVTKVSKTFKVPNTDWAFVALSIDGERQILVSGLNTKQGMKALARARKEIEACKTTKKFVTAARTNDEHPGFYTDLLHHYGGIEVEVSALAVVRPDLAK